MLGGMISIWLFSVLLVVCRINVVDGQKMCEELSSEDSNILKLAGEDLKISVQCGGAVLSPPLMLDEQCVVAPLNGTTLIDDCCEIGANVTQTCSAACRCNAMSVDIDLGAPFLVTQLGWVSAGGAATCDSAALSYANDSDTFVSGYRSGSGSAMCRDDVGWRQPALPIGGFHARHLRIVFHANSTSTSNNNMVVCFVLVVI
jgi:hypothetical protein